MKRSIQTHKRRWLAIFGFLALGVLLIGNPSPLAVQKNAQAGWRVEIEEGKTARSTLSINNRCKAIHQFRVDNKVNYLRFEQSTQAIPIGAAATAQLGVVFDATGQKLGVHRDKLIVKCLDCKKEKGCAQDRDEVPVEMTVTKLSLDRNARIEIATYDPRSGRVISFKKNLLNRKFEDGVKVSEFRVEKQLETFYLLRRGLASGNSRLARTELIDSGRGSLSLPARTTTTTETCTGCSYCDFAPGGGCVCKPMPPAPYGNGICIHTVTKTTTGSLMAPGKEKLFIQ